MIQLDNISYQYPQTHSPIIRDYSASFERGEIVAITGRNGSGKTTLTRLMAGILRPTIGKIMLDGADTTGMDLYEIGCHIGLVFENPARQMFCPTVFEEVAFGRQESGSAPEEIKKQTNDIMTRLHISHLASQHPYQLSRGEKQCVMLAAMLSRRTNYFILDEPTTGLDLRTRHDLGRLLVSLARQSSAGIVVVSHERDFIKAYADREVVCG
ncbi:MAG TPA: ABC transporter ATP-binding protein [Clostridiales bacterium]|nr:ABC transporter ATP-binding protein [Clostridiales bacterium]